MTQGPIRTTCPYCGVGCGIVATPLADGSVQIAGDPTHPANFGRLCSKGAALGTTMSLDDRLLYPEIDGVRATWEAALDLVALRFQETIAAHGPESVAFYVSGQLLTEDYYAANKLMKGYIGSANIDTNSRLCMASSVAGHRRAFGADTVPGTYEDLDHADLVVLVGSNLAWCHPVLFQRLETARLERGTKVVVIDPRETATCTIADLHLPLKPGSDVALFNGLFTHLVQHDKVKADYVTTHTSGFEAALTAASSLALPDIAKATGLSPGCIREFYALFAANERCVTVYSQGVNQSTVGTDKVNAIINCHLLTGRIGTPGTGPFSVTGQPNAMGGREVGGLANMLAAHMDLDRADHREIVQSFWGSPAIASQPGLKAVDLFRAVGAGRIKAIWIMATNPVDSMPEADTVRAALEACPFVVVSDVTRLTDTTDLADVLLPAAAWGEKDGTVTNSERRISRQRSFLPLPGDVRADWWQLSEVAKRMGFADAFTFAGPHEIYTEYAQLTGAHNGGRRDLDLSAHGALTHAQYDAMEPVQWPLPTGAAETHRSRFFADGGFFTADRRARFVPTPHHATAVQGTGGDTLVLNTGRIRDQWHTMTRTAKTPRLLSHIAEPFVEIHPTDATRLGLTAATIAELESPHGKALVRVQVTARQRSGTVFAPMHWTDQYASRARIDALVQGDVDPISGQPGLKQTAISVRPYVTAWYGFAVTRARLQCPHVAYWATAPIAGGWRTELADGAPLGSARDALPSWIAAGADTDYDVLSYGDAASGQQRIALFDDAGLVAALFVSRFPVAVSRTWLVEQLNAGAIDPMQRLRLLAGRGGAEAQDRGAIVCACFDVGRNQIEAAVAAQGCSSVRDVGEKLRAGTNCGSCRAEIGRIIDECKITHVSAQAS
jgi:assimilatory nitrate reductase catalytic subunit